MNIEFFASWNKFIGKIISCVLVWPNPNVSSHVGAKWTKMGMIL